MIQYMVEFKMPEIISQEFMALIPEQRATINLLMAEGIVTTYTLAQNRTKLWTTLMAKDEEHLLKIIDTFPLIKYLKPEITEWMFHESVSYKFPYFSLN